jgi:hypothetical protein
LRIKAGAPAAVKGPSRSAELTSQLPVPSAYSLRVSGIEPVLADNDNFAADQVLNLQFKQRVADKEARQTFFRLVLPHDKAGV